MLVRLKFALATLAQPSAVQQFAVLARMALGGGSVGVVGLIRPGVFPHYPKASGLGVRRCSICVNRLFAAVLWIS